MQRSLTVNFSGTLSWEEPPPSLRPRLMLVFEGTTVTGGDHMAFTLPIDKSVEVAVSYVDAHGNPVDLPQGNVAWETSDTALLDVTADAADDQKATLHPAGPLGNAQVTCTGHNPDGSPVIATLDVSLVAGNAVTGTIQPVGTPA